jgi:lysophospholipase L1-like esterase
VRRRLLASAILVALGVHSATAADHVQPRGGLTLFFQKLARAERGEKDEKGEAIRPRIVYYGGSITAGAGASKPELCYRSLLTKRLRALYPKSNLVESNAALGGTGSWLGAFRLRRDVLDHWLPADLVVVEFAVNDGGEPEPRVLGALEGIVRQLKKRQAATDILFVYTLVRSHVDDYQKGELPSRVRWHETIAAHYGIPSVNVGRYAASKILAGELTMDDVAKDGVHPSDRGHALYVEALESFLAACREAAERSDPAKPAPLPAPFSPRNLEGARMVPYEIFPLEGAWKVGQDSPVANFLHVLVGDAPAATIALRFRGRAAGYFDVIGPDTGDLEFAVDGGAWQKRPNWDIFCAGSTRAHARVLAEDLDPTAEHTIRIRIAETQPAGSRGRFFRLAFLLIDGSPAVPDPYAGLEPLARIDAVYAGMEPMRYAPPADRWTPLEKTRRRLAGGPSLRIVLLGDSIVNDTSASRFELLLGRMYPACAIEKVTSVRGSTGCRWYKEENRVQAWVLRHQPDLLMIGGISQGDDTDSIREVIRQVRAQAPACEFLLMTGAFGSMDPRKDKAWTADVPADGTGYRTRLLKLAAEERCGFLDMTGPWGTYIRASSKGLGWFKRDPIHANDRGFQILGRIVAAFLGRE